MLGGCCVGGACFVYVGGGVVFHHFQFHMGIQNFILEQVWIRGEFQTEVLYKQKLRADLGALGVLLILASITCISELVGEDV